MGSPIYVTGAATITPPLVLGGEPLAFVDWEVSEDGTTLAFVDDEGYARHYDDALDEIVTEIKARGSVVNGAFEWEVSDDGQFGKTVIADNVITDHAGFKAYADGTTENDNFQWREKHSPDCDHIEADPFSIDGVYFYPAGIIYEVSIETEDEDAEPEVYMLEDMVHSGTLYFEDDDIQNYEAVAARVKEDANA